MVPFSFAGHALCALPDAALFWPARRALIVADLHFEKASWFAKWGQMLPPYDSVATLDGLEALITRTDARELWCLGDSFHDSDGGARLSSAVQARLRSLTDRMEWHWILGNHDAAMGEAATLTQIGGRVVDEAEVDGLMLRHIADPNDPRPELSGHFHPKLRLSLRGRRVSRRCFVVGGNKLVLPAFGALTGGLDVDHPEILRAVGRGAHAMVALDNRLLRFPIAA